jgi:hypothetical protein
MKPSGCRFQKAAGKAAAVSLADSNDVVPILWSTHRSALVSCDRDDEVLILRPITGKRSMCLNAIHSAKGMIRSYPGILRVFFVYHTYSR